MVHIFFILFLVVALTHVRKCIFWHFPPKCLSSIDLPPPAIHYWANIYGTLILQGYPVHNITQYYPKEINKQTKKTSPSFFLILKRGGGAQQDNLLENFILFQWFSVLVFFVKTKYKETSLFWIN